MQYANLRAAADCVAGAFAALPAVRRIVLFGSVASPPRPATHHWGRGTLHQPKDVDLAVWLDEPSELGRLRRLSAQAVNRLWNDREMGGAHHQVDVFLFDPTGRYLGRLCHFSQCPKDKPPCRAEGCGLVRFLRQHDEFRFNAAESFHSSRMQVLYERTGRKPGA